MVTNIRVNCGIPQHGIEEFLLVDVEEIYQANTKDQDQSQVDQNTPSVF